MRPTSSSIRSSTWPPSATTGARSRSGSRRVAERPYEPRRPRAPLFVGLAVGLAAVLAVAAWQLDSREEAAPARTEPVSAPRTQPAAEPATPAPAPARPLLLTARDDSWVAVRFRTAKGKLVWAGTLRRGRTLKLGLAKPLWIRAGKPTALAAAVGSARDRSP